MTAATYAFSAFERSKELIRIYDQAGVESRLPGAKSVQELAERLEAIRERVIKPVLLRKHAELPDPRKFLDQFSVPVPEDGKVEVFDREIDDLYTELKTSIEKVVK